MAFGAGRRNAAQVTSRAALLVSAWSWIEVMAISRYKTVRYWRRDVHRARVGRQDLSALKE